MNVFYRLDHHQMIFMEEWFDMGLTQFTIWVEAGEEFGVVFITEEFGAFTVEQETVDKNGLLVQSADYLVAD